MTANYKEKREELDELLYDMEVPRDLFHNLTSLNFFVANERFYHEKAQLALDIIQEIAPMPLTRFKLTNLGRVVEVVSNENNSN